MIIWCIKRLHSFLSFFLNSRDDNIHTSPAVIRRHNLLSPAGGLSLIVANPIKDSHFPLYILESAAIRPPQPPPLEKRNRGGIDFLYEVGDHVDGMSCVTESLGFESSDERRVEGIEIDQITAADGYFVSERSNFSARKKLMREQRKERTYPPLISSLNDDGKPNSILRSMRKNGRLEILEFRIERPEILRASRENGRLRLQLVQKEDLIEEEEEMGGTEEEILAGEGRRFPVIGVGDG